MFCAWWRSVVERGQDYLLAIFEVGEHTFARLLGATGLYRVVDLLVVAVSW